MLESFSNTWQQPSVSPDPWHCEPYWHCNCSSLMGFCALAAVPAAPPTVHCFSQVPSASAAPSRVSFAPRIALQAWQGSPNPAPEKCNLCCNHTSPSKHLIPYHFPISFSSVAINQFLHQRMEINIPFELPTEECPSTGSSPRSCLHPRQGHHSQAPLFLSVRSDTPSGSLAR